MDRTLIEKKKLSDEKDEIKFLKVQIVNEIRVIKSLRSSSASQFDVAFYNWILLVLTVIYCKSMLDPCIL